MLSIAALLTGALGRIESLTVDTRFALRGGEPADDVAVVALDDADIAHYGRWPLDRTLHARAIDRLREAGVRQIAYDVQFTEAGATARGDLALYDAVSRAKGIVLATTTVREDGDTDVLGGEANLGPAFARASNSLLPTEVGGQIRRVPYVVNGLTSFAVAAAEAAKGRNVGPGGFDGGARGAHRLPRHAGHRADLLVPRARRGPDPGVEAPRPRGGGRRLGAVAAGRPSRAD